MESITADLVSSDEIVIHGLKVRLVLDPLGTWAGSFDLPPNATRLDLEGYRLIASDGREGEIRIDRISVSPDGTELWFTGVDEFA